MVDDIVVVDTGSIDDTAQIARRHGARVYSEPWAEDFAIPRNISLEKARGQWVLVLDCDEVLAAGDHARIESAIASEAADAYRLTTRNYTDSTESSGWTATTGGYAEERAYRGWYPTTKVRLWRAHPDVRFTGAVHELVEPSLQEHSRTIADCPVPVHHYGRVEKSRRTDQYVTAGERKLQDNPTDLRSRYELAIAYRDSGRLEEALANIGEVVSTLADEAVYLNEEHVHLVHGDILDRLGRFDEAVATYEDVTERFPESYQAYNNIGSVLSRRGEWDRATAFFEKALRVGGGSNPTIAANLARVESRIQSLDAIADHSGAGKSPYRLSVCMIVKDGGQDLRRSLASVQSVADELIVVDTGSSDDSVAVAEEFGARVSTFEWGDDFAAARNASLDRATGDWILWLDADDYLLDGDRQKVAGAKRLTPDRGFYFDLVNEGGADTTRFRQAATFSGRTRLELGDYEKAMADLRQSLECDPHNVLTLLSLGDALTKCGRYDDALGFLQRGLEGTLDPNFPAEPHLTEYSLQFFLGQCYQALGRFPEARDAFEAAHRVLPQRPEATTALEQLQVEQLQATAAGDAGIGLATDPNNGTVNMPADRGATCLAEPALALCMIVRDEAERLPKCLDSVAGLFDEIVIVDTGSSDGTVAIAESYGARVDYFEWCDDFSAARNQALQMVTADWIIWLDADDLLPLEYHDEIRTLIRGPRDTAYFFELDDRGYENVSCLQMRLFPNVPGVAFEMPIHEQVTPSLAAAGVAMEPTRVRVIHTGYTTPEVVREKKTRYLEIMERWLEAHPHDYIVRSHVALTYHTTGRLEEAARAYHRIVEDGTCLDDHNYVVHTTSLLFLGRTYHKMKDSERARDYMQQAHDFDPDYVLTKLSLAELCSDLEEWQRAADFASEIVEGGRQVTFFPVDQQELRYSALCLAGRAFQHLGRVQDAEASFEEAFRQPVARRSEALGSLSELYKSLGRRDDARTALARALEVTPDSAKHVFNDAVIFLEDGDFDAAAARFHDVLRLSPDYVPALLNLGYISKSRGEVDIAIALYKKVIDADSAHVDARANLAHVYLAQERWAEAIETFQAVRALDRSLLDINLGLLLALSARAQWDSEVYADAMAPFAGEVGPPRSEVHDAAPSLLNLGAVLVRQDLCKCAEFAFEIATRLLEGISVPGQDQAVAVVPRRCLGELHFSQGDFWKSVAQYEAILLADPRDGDAFRRLGDCYAKLGVADAAQMCYDQSRKAGN